MIAMVALFVALGGAAYAATSINGKNIENGTITGSKLKKHTLTGTQINESKLGSVPHATHADSATNATTATTATNATDLNGLASSAYEPSANFTRSGLVTAASGQSTVLTSFGPFTLTLDCVAGTAGAVQAEIFATSTIAHAVGYETAMPVAGQSYLLPELVAGPPGTPSTAWVEQDDNAADFLTLVGSNFISDVTLGENWPGGSPSTCYANALTSPS